MNTVKIWVQEGSVDSTTKASLPSLSRVAVNRSIEIGAEVLQNSIRSFSQQFTGLLDGQPLEGGVLIDEIELSLVITASGGIELLGKLSVGAQAGIKVKLKRVQ